MMLEKFKPGWWVLVLAFVSLSCNLPLRATPTPSGAAALFTSAAETVQAQLTQAAQPSPSPGEPSYTPSIPTFSETPTFTLTPSATATLVPTHTPLPPSFTPTPIPCNLVKFVEDVTIPDNTEVDPGQVFVKTWRLKNAGSCTWSTAYTLVPEGDNLFSAPAAVPLPAAVPPGGTVDISVTLTAPMVAGTHRGNFKLATASGQRFGWGDGTKPFWVQVKVVVPGGLVFDFIARASQAEWKSGVGSSFDTPLSFGGADVDPNGVAKIKEGEWLENGAISGKVLLTFPKRVFNGVIGGLFAPFLVQSGDVFKARLGFLAGPGGICGAGQVTFELQYKEGGTYHSLGQWEKACDGSLLPIAVSLASLKGKTVQFLLIVHAHGDFMDDWAIWSSPRIER